MRSTYSLTRAEEWPERASFPVPIPRTVVLFVGLFVIGLALGWIVTRPFAAPSAQYATTTDYVAVVAQLYARDHNLTLAKERLSLFGSPAALVSQASSSPGNLRNPDDLAAVQSLGQALSTGDATTAPAASASPASGGSASVLGAVIAFILALGLGAIVLLRTAGLSLPRLSLPSRRPARTQRDAGAGTARAPVATTARAEPFAPRRPARPEAPVEPPREAERPAVTLGPRRADPVRTATRPRPRARVLTFESSYRQGDDPFDEIHPIIDPVSGSLVAACGLNAALKSDGPSGADYYAFAAWIQDYVNGETLNAVGLVTRESLQTQREPVEEWTQRGQIDAIFVAERGTTTELTASDLRAKVTVLDVSLAPNGGNACFESLTVRFEVNPVVTAAEE